MRKLTLTLGIALLAVAFPAANASAPYEETLFDRSWPSVPERASMAGDASAGTTVYPGSPWDRDHNFVAPAQ